jgi:DNA-nicking Smr family endonuclease
MGKSRNSKRIAIIEAPRQKRTREVTPEEAALWEEVARSIEPLGKGPHKARLAMQLKRRPAPPSPPAHIEKPERPVAQPAQKPKPSKAGPAQTFEPKRARRLAKGRIAIDARLDLHGMTQSEAHAALSRFLANAHAQGLRHVKIITGKGRSGEAAGERSTPWEAESGRGVLRRMVPQWLGEPAMRAIVVSYTEAGRGHGGEGALYVHLRRAGRARDDR